MSMDPKKMENLVQVLSDYIENAAAEGHKHQLEYARAAVDELDALTDGAVKWDDFIAPDDEDEG